jgi:hypothetical protein
MALTHESLNLVAATGYALSPRWQSYARQVLAAEASNAAATAQRMYKSLDRNLTPAELMRRRINRQPVSLS